jgi:hypothetical protein
MLPLFFLQFPKQIITEYIVVVVVVVVVGVGVEWGRGEGTLYREENGLTWTRHSVYYS